MNVILLTIDSLNRAYLSPYGHPSIQTPNFERLAKRCITMDNFYTCSQPTLLGRQELLAGRANYLWRGWGALEPFDITIPARCEQADKMSMIVTDNYHYWSKGAGDYTRDFTGNCLIRGHEKDNYCTDPIDVNAIPEIYQGMIAVKGLKKSIRYIRNTRHFSKEEDFFSPRVLQRAAGWLDRNHTYSDFFLYIDSFDVHEPFHVPPPYDTMYNPGFRGTYPLSVKYGHVEEYGEDVVKQLKAVYMGNITMLDKWMGKVLDKLDTYNLWDNSLVIVTSDHGYHFGENEFIGKNAVPYFDTQIHIPLFISFPGMKPTGGSRSDLLGCSVDLFPTICQALGLTIEKEYLYHGHSMLPALRGESDAIRKIVHTGHFGGGLAATDGRYTLHLPSLPGKPLYIYGMHLEGFHTRDMSAYEDVELGHYVPFTRAKVLRKYLEKPLSLGGSKVDDKPDFVKALIDNRIGDSDLRIDSSKGPQNVIESHPEIAAKLEHLLSQEFDRIQAPAEQYDRLGISRQEA